MDNANRAQAPPSDSIRFTETLLNWFHEHPGFHRPRDIAADLDADPQAVATRTRYLWQQGRVSRQPRMIGSRIVNNQSVYGVTDA